MSVSVCVCVFVGGGVDIRFHVLAGSSREGVGMNPIDLIWVSVLGALPAVGLKGNQGSFPTPPLDSLRFDLSHVGFCSLGQKFLGG